VIISETVLLELATACIPLSGRRRRFDEIENRNNKGSQPIYRIIHSNLSVDLAQNLKKLLQK
jgi:hypothetical protein